MSDDEREDEEEEEQEEEEEVLELDENDERDKSYTPNDGDDDENKKTPKRKPKKAVKRMREGFTPGKKLDLPLPELELQTINARLKTINDKKLPRFEKIAVEHAQALFDLGGEFNELFHQNETVLTLFFLQS